MEIINDVPTPEECASLIFEYSGRKVAPKVAEDLWSKILQHKWVLSEKLGRDVGTTRCGDKGYVFGFYRKHRAHESPSTGFGKNPVS
jgi:hypothetical protein